MTNTCDRFGIHALVESILLVDLPEVFAAQSAVIPGLAPSFIREFLDCETQTEAVRKMRATLRK